MHFESILINFNVIGVTLDTYAHLINNMELDAINGVEKAFLVNR